jgi:hypothetical protein
MRLYVAVTTEQARRAIDAGFVGRSWVTYPPDATLEEMTSGRREAEAKVAEFVEFRNLPPSGPWEATTEFDGVHLDFGSDPIQRREMFGDFVLSIEVPDDVALAGEVKEDDPFGWPFREFGSRRSRRTPTGTRWSCTTLTPGKRCGPTSSASSNSSHT